MILDKIIVSDIAPANTGVVWIKPVDDSYEQYVHLNSKWVKISNADKEDTHQPFRGWFASPSALSATYPTPKVGDYAYVKGATESANVYECSVAGTWTYSDRTFNPANNQEFASGEALNTVHIVDGLESSSPTDVLSAKQGKVLDEKVAALGPKSNHITYQAGFFLTDFLKNIAVKYDSNGFDVAKLSDNLKTKIRSICHIVEIEEHGLALIDNNRNIGVFVDNDGIHSRNSLFFDIV